jgi:hypothetical protein
LFRNRLRENVQKRRLPGAGTATNKNGFAIPDLIAQVVSE